MRRRLSDEDKQQLRACYISGLSPKWLAQKFGISDQTVFTIVKDITYTPKCDHNALYDDIVGLTREKVLRLTFRVEELVETTGYRLYDLNVMLDILVKDGRLISHKTVYRVI